MRALTEVRESGDRSAQSCSIRGRYEVPRIQFLEIVRGAVARMGLIYFGIRVTDLERSLRFYIEGLGLEELRRGRLPHGGKRVLLEDEKTGQRLELNWYPDGSPFALPYVAGDGLDHLGFSTGHAADMARRLGAHGGRIVLSPSDLNGVRRNFYVADPDGNWAELMGWGSPKPSVGRAARKGAKSGTSAGRQTRARG